MGDFDKEFYTIDELAELLRIHRKAIERCIHKGEIEAYKLGKQYRISRNELERLKTNNNSN